MRAVTEDQATAPQPQVDLRRRRFTVAEYHRMAEVGILMEDDPVELIAGEIIEMSPMGMRHVWCLNSAVDLLADMARQEAIISVQNPIRLSGGDEPEPDIALIRRSAPRNAIPGPDDILLVIEIADSSRDYDRSVKLPLYAAAGIKESWLFDLVAGTIERHTEPRRGTYHLIARASRGESLASTVLPGVTFSVDAILG